MARRRSTLQRTAEIPGSTDYSDVFEGRARLATIAVLLAFVAVFFGTATIFQIEDDNPLTGSAFDALSAHLTRARRVPGVRFLDAFHDDPGYIQAL